MASNGAVYTTIIDGQEVSLFSQADANFPVNAEHTEWLVVRFNQFITHELSQILQQRYNLEIHEKLTDGHVYLCKYTPTDLSPVIGDDIVTHLNLYPIQAVTSGLTLDPIDTNGSDGRAAEDAEGEGAHSVRVAVALHPNPSQTPQQILHHLETQHGAEHLDSAIHTPANLVRVRLSRGEISAVAAIDSVRSIEEVNDIVPHSLRVDSVLGTHTQRTKSVWTGLDEIIYIADSGFDTGSTEDVHSAFTGRVLGTESMLKDGNSTGDYSGHGTHVAGSALASLTQSVGDDMMNIEGTAPEAKLISVAIDFGKPAPLDLFTGPTHLLPQPVIHSNSWGHNWKGIQKGYGNEDARIVDQAMAQDSKLCILFAAGNQGHLLNGHERQQQIGAWAAARNSIVVGATFSTRPLDGWGRYSADGDVHVPKEITYFSSRGPTALRGLGVDVVAPGHTILSARSRYTQRKSLDEIKKLYGEPAAKNLLFMSGTSMSTPAVAGCVACLRQAYRATYDIAPSGAMLKALIIHGAVDTQGTRFNNIVGEKQTRMVMPPAPNTFQGYGLVNFQNSVAPLVKPMTDLNGVLDGGARNGLRKVRTLQLSHAVEQLVVTLAYSDQPGLVLQDEIELFVERDNGRRILPLQPNDPLNRQNPPLEFRKSNVAKIVVTNAPADTYRIMLGTKTQQEYVLFALVWSAS